MTVTVIRPDDEWHEELASQLRRFHPTRTRLDHWAGMVLVAALVCSLAGVVASSVPGPSRKWAFAGAIAGVVVGILAGFAGLVVAVWLGRLATRLHGWGDGRAGLLGSLALAGVFAVEFVAFSIIGIVVFGGALSLAVLLMVYALSGLGS